MLRGKSIIFLAAVIAGGLWGGTAQAEIGQPVIKAFNAAVRSGDRAAIKTAATDLSTAVLADPSAKGAAVMGFEAAFQLCVVAACDGAKEVAAKVAKLPIDDPTAHPIASDRALLRAYVEWRQEPTSKIVRAKFDQALKSLVDKEPTLLSETAFFARLATDMRTSLEYAQRHASAEEAARHFQSSYQISPEFASFTAMEAAVEGFHVQPDAKARLTLVDAHARFLRWRQEAGEADANAPWVSSHEERLRDWAKLMDVTLERLEEKAPSTRDIEAIYERHGVANAIQAETDAARASAVVEIDPAIVCGILAASDNPAYPIEAQNSNIEGDAIVRATLTEGKLTRVRVTASYPSLVFGEEARRAANAFTWDRQPDVDPAKCEGREMVLPFRWRLK